MFEVDDLQVCRRCGILFSKKATTASSMRCPNCKRIDTEKAKLL